MKYLIGLLIIFNCFADVIDNRQYSERYYAGEYMIYDCYDKHWVCADSDAHKKCLADRKEDIKNDIVWLSCIPVKKYKTVKSCISSLQTVVDNPVDDLLCQHPTRLQKPFISL